MLSFFLKYRNFFFFIKYIIHIFLNLIIKFFFLIFLFDFNYISLSIKRKIYLEYKMNLIFFYYIPNLFYIFFT